MSYVFPSVTENRHQAEKTAARSPEKSVGSEIFSPRFRIPLNAKARIPNTATIILEFTALGKKVNEMGNR